MRRVAWALWLTIVAIGVGLGVAAVGDGVGPFISYLVFVLAFATVGALVLSRHPRNPIGWILLGAGLAYVVGGVTITVSENGAEGPWGTLAAWVGSWVWVTGIGPVGTFGLLLFPDGRLPSRRWRPVAWLAGGGLAGLLAGLALEPGRFDDLSIENPVGLEAVPWLPGAIATAGTVALIAALVGSIASLGARYRAARLSERMQLKWLLYAAVLVAAGIAVSVTIEIVVGSSVSNLTNSISTLTLASVPVSMGIAILRHRLYDIDVVIRRTLVYGSLTALLTGTYIAVVLLLQFALGPLTEGSSVAVALSTLVVAAAFRPARRRVQVVVDRRFYRRRFDADRTLDAFGGRLRDQVDIDALRGELAAVVRETMEPAHVSLWLRPIHSTVTLPVTISGRSPGTKDTS